MALPEPFKRKFKMKIKFQFKRKNLLLMIRKQEKIEMKFFRFRKCRNSFRMHNRKPFPDIPEPQSIQLYFSHVSRDFRHPSARLVYLKARFEIPAGCATGSHFRRFRNRETINYIFPMLLVNLDTLLDL